MQTSKTGSFKRLARHATLNLLLVACFVIISKVNICASGTVRPDVENLLSDLRSDFITPEDDAKLTHELSTRPDIKPDLFAALDRDYFQGKDDGRFGHTTALSALTYRKDLTPEELKIITDELNKWAGITESRSRYNKSFLGTGILVLKNYPSKENEELALKYLGDKNVSWEIMMETLGNIGAEYSREAIMKWRDKFKVENPEYTIFKDMDEAIAKIEKRINSKKQTTQKPVNDVITVQNQTLNNTIKTGNEATKGKTILWLFAAACTAIITLAFLFLRKSK